MKFVYLGFNDFRKYKRGVENVIEFQSSLFDDWCYYIHWGHSYRIYKYKKMVCISLPSFSVKSLILLSLIIRRFFMKYKGNVLIHSHNVLMSVFLYKKTNVFTVHDGLYYQNKSIGTRGLKLCIFYILEKVLYRRCKHIHFISNFTKSQSLYPNSFSNYSLIYNTSNFEENIRGFRPDIQLLYDNYPFLKGKKYCFIVRSIEERARIDLVIKVAEKYPSLVFVVAGKGPLLNNMLDLIQKRNVYNVKLLGFVPDTNLFQLYAFSEFVMVPAEYGEGFGLPIIEAYLFNKLVFASNRCAIPEVIVDKKCLFENNMNSIIACIEIYDKFTNFNYLKHYQENFSSEVIAKQYKQLYKLCI